MLHVKVTGLLGAAGITDFHGYGALRVGWKIYLQSLRKATPFDVVRSKTIRAVRRRSSDMSVAGKVAL